MKHARSDYDRIQDPDGKIPANEPVFLIRGQDVCAYATSDPLCRTRRDRRRRPEDGGSDPCPRQGNAAVATDDRRLESPHVPEGALAPARAEDQPIPIMSEAAIRAVFNAPDDMTVAEVRKLIEDTERIEAGGAGEVLRTR